MTQDNDNPPDTSSTAPTPEEDTAKAKRGRKTDTGATPRQQRTAARDRQVMQEAAARVVANAPPLTPEQRARLAELLNISPPPDTPPRTPT